MAKPIVVPPGGFVGFGQNTAATQALFGGFLKGAKGSSRKKRRTKKRRTARKTTARRKPTRRRATKKRLVKGSAAAKRHMAKLRRMRK